MGKTILCADSESIAMPTLIGLAETELDSLGWLESISDATEARERCRAGDVSEIWIVGTDNFTSLNLAAALRKDSEDTVITIVESDPTGSFLSRASQARVTRVISSDEFCALFYSEVRRRSLMNEVAMLDIEVSSNANIASQSSPINDDIAYSKVSKPIEASFASTAEPEPVRGDAFVMSVFGGSGGVGKSSFCAIAAHAIASKGFSTVLVDLDLQFGDATSLCADAVHIPIERVLDEPDALLGVAEKAGMTPVVIGSPKNIEDSESIATKAISVLSSCASAFDIVVINTQSIWNELAVSILERSTCPVFMMDQRSSSVRACMRITELCTRMGVATGSFVYALNRCSKRSMFNPLDVSNAMQGVQVFELNDGSSEVEEMLGAGGALELLESDNPFVRCIHSLVTEMIPTRGSHGGKRRTSRGNAAGKKAIKGTKGAALERRTQRSKRKREKRSSEANDESLFSALFGSANRAEAYLADEMRAPK